MRTGGCRGNGFLLLRRPGARDIFRSHTLFDEEGPLSTYVSGSFRRTAAALLLFPALFPVAGSPADSRPVNLPFKDMNGNRVRVSDLRGKPVVLNFWATWCVPCRAEMPFFVEAEKEYAPRGVSFVAVSLDEKDSRPKIPDF